MADQLSAASLALRDDSGDSQAQHRAEILATFNIPSNAQVLEIGCGQGDMTTVLASSLTKSHVDAIDPAPLDYGSPETLGAAQARRKATDYGPRISFHRADPIAWLERQERDAYDAAVLCHCLWYFSSIEEIKSVFTVARSKAKRLYIAEWSLQASRKGGESHVLAALARGTCEGHIPDSDQNIRTPIAPAQIKILAEESGWRLEREKVLTPNAGLEDAKWEVDMLLHDHGREFLERGRTKILEKRMHVLLQSMLEAVHCATVREQRDLGGLRCMDVWIGVLE